MTDTLLDEGAERERVARSPPKTLDFAAKLAS